MGDAGGWRAVFRCDLSNAPSSNNNQSPQGVAENGRGALGGGKIYTAHSPCHRFCFSHFRTQKLATIKLYILTILDIYNKLSLLLYINYNYILYILQRKRKFASWGGGKTGRVRFGHEAEKNQKTYKRLGKGGHSGGKRKGLYLLPEMQTENEDQGHTGDCAEALSSVVSLVQARDHHRS